MNASIQILEEIAKGNNFAAKVAQTVLTNKSCSRKQFEILEKENCDIYMDDLYFIDIDNLKVNPSFEKMQEKSILAQRGLLGLN